MTIQKREVRKAAGWSNYVLKKIMVACAGAFALVPAIAANSLPTVRLSTPADNSSFVVPGVLVLQAVASDSDGTISKVQFYDGTTLLGTDTATPFTYSWNNPTVGTHKLTAKVTDNSGAIVTSPVVTLQAKANASPSISLTGPATDVSLVAPATITLTANASDIDGSVTKVAYYRGTTLIASASVAPWSVVWNSNTVGSNAITARATDDKGAVTISAARSVTVTSNKAPSVSFLTPAINATYAIPAAISMTANATDADGSVVKVSYYNGTVLLGSATVAPFAFTWQANSSGTYSLTARATDDKGTTTTSAIRTLILKKNTLPTISISSPVANAVYTSPATIPLRADARDADGNVRKVEYFSGSTPIGATTVSPFDLVWGEAWVGQHTITARVTDDSGAVVTSNPVNVSVKANSAPAVNIAAPLSGAIFAAPANILLSANAVDSDGAVLKVEYFDGSVMLGSVANAPYTFNWTGVVAGNHVLTAKATDNKGAVTTSDAITFRVVENVAPTIALSEPMNNSILPGPATFTLRASAVDSDGTIAKVEFYNGNTMLGSVKAAPYLFDVVSLPAGDYVFSARAVDNFGAISTAEISIKVSNNALPSVGLTVNATTATAPANFILSATASDTDGVVTSVQFFSGTVLIGTMNEAPYTFPVSASFPGTYTFSARATDDKGGITISNSVPVDITGESQSVYFVNTDHLDTPRVVLDSANIEVWKWELGEPFGLDLPDEDPVRTQRSFRFNFRFPGQYYDSESGLHYNYFRDYDPQTGRYVQSDPIGLGGGLNTYGYVGGNPLSGIDRFGLSCTSTGGKFSCDTPGGPSFGPLPAPTGWPSLIDASVEGYHYYGKPTQAGRCKRTDLWPSLKKGPIPWKPNPATEEGNINNATPPWIQHGMNNGPLSPGPQNLVKSYVTTDLNTGNPIVVNVTEPGHSLFPGYTARTINEHAAGSSMITFGEGLGALQSDADRSRFIRDLINNVWYEDQEKIIGACGCM